MKTTAIPLIMALSAVVALGQDATGNVARDSMLNAPSLERSAGLLLRTSAPDEIQFRKATVKGSLVALLKSDNPLSTFNPFKPSDSANEAEDFKTDRLLGRPRGIVFFWIRF
jgi:hypothetical protein